MNKKERQQKTLGRLKQAGEPTRGAKARRNSQTILVVEDIGQLRGLLVKYLKAEGYVILDAEDAELALETYRTYGKSVQLLLTDVLLPGMNGKELATRLLASCADIQVLFMSGCPEASTVKLSATDLRCRFIKKPFRLGELAKRIREILTD